MKPLDPRLLRYARSARTALARGAAIGLVRTLAIVLWCWSLAHSLALVVAPFLNGEHYGSVLENSYTQQELPKLITLAAIAAVLRALASWLLESSSARAAIKVKSQLRSRVLTSFDTRSPLRISQQRAQAGSAKKLNAVILGRGLDALDGYFANYVPQLLLTVIATPIFIVALFLADHLSALIVVIVFPIIPVFMVLIGLATQKVQDRQWQELAKLSRSFLDIISGLGTLKIFSRENKQHRNITASAASYRKRTMQVLRVSFLSGFVLDLAGTFSVALVAVTVGTRLISGEYALALGLFVLFLTPEVFVPIRQVGVAFHASTEGLAAAEDIFNLLAAEKAEQAEDDSVASAVHKEHAFAEDVACGVHDLVVKYAENTKSIGPISFTAAKGEIIALTGPSGAGKSTVINVLSGFLEPACGTVKKPRLCAWAGQQAMLLHGSVIENIALAEKAAGKTIDRVLAREILDSLGLTDIALDLQLSALGEGVSGGQKQRIALARALYFARRNPAAVVLVDEPTSALDEQSEKLVAKALVAISKAGHAVLLVSHRKILIEIADRQVPIRFADTADTGFEVLNDQ